MTKKISRIALIAALYTVAGLAFAPFAFGAVQVRIAEALTLTAALSPIGIWGVTLGCFITNFVGYITGANILGILDIFVGTAATLIAAAFSYALRKQLFLGVPVLSALSPIIFNGLIIGAELTFLINGGFPAIPFLAMTASVAAGEAVACIILGLPLWKLLKNKGLF